MSKIFVGIADHEDSSEKYEYFSIFGNNYGCGFGRRSDAISRIANHIVANNGENRVTYEAPKPWPATADLREKRFYPLSPIERINFEEEIQWAIAKKERESQ